MFLSFLILLASRDNWFWNSQLLFLNSIAEKRGLDNRIDALAKKDAFITLKDHKPNFQNNPTCRLINPTKSEIGIISKQILERINQKVVEATGVNQWKNTQAVLEWYKNIPNKNNHSFISFDVVDFYPSITENLLIEALNFASKYDNITDEEKALIIQAKQSLLFNDNEAWCKKSSKTQFDVTMGSYDGAETCELVGSYLLSKLSPQHRKKLGLYRDDGLGAFDETPRKIEIIKKLICRTFADHNLKLTIEANKKCVHFLDVTLDMRTGTFKPYTSPVTQSSTSTLAAITHLQSYAVSPKPLTEDYQQYLRTKKRLLKLCNPTKKL